MEIQVENFLICELHLSKIKERNGTMELGGLKRSWL